MPSSPRTRSCRGNVCRTRSSRPRRTIPHPRTKRRTGIRRRRTTSSPPVDARAFLEELTADDPETAACLIGTRELRAREPRLDPFPEDLPEIVRSRLGLLGIEGLYPHQSRGLESLR